MRRPIAGAGKTPYEFAYRCTACERTLYSCSPNLVEQGTRCPRCSGVLKRRAGYDRPSASST